MTTLPRILTLMGSGETAPTMVKVHREVMNRLGSNASAALLDTPYGFQENASELAQKAVQYFSESIVTDLAVAGLTRIEGTDPVALERGFNLLRTSTYVFAGPGSPTYALRQWTGSPLSSVLVDKLKNGGAVTFASAAALTLGRVTIPVYEIYKAGEEPRWLDGLDVLGEIGIHAALIPHYDNAEGGHHDTRFCYLGERRLRMLEAELPPGHHVIGIDEHTAVMLDLDADTATVIGRGVLSVRVNGATTTHAAGTTIPIDALRHPDQPTTAAAPVAVAAAPVEAAAADSLGATTEALGERFASALAAGDADGAVRAALELEATIHAWSADTLQSREGDEARAMMRSMISRLGAAATGGLADPRERVGPFIETLLALRGEVRKDKRYDLSDLIRDRLTESGVEVRDTPTGPEWLLV
jgi:cyanophycinase-like exopeptidase